MFVKLILQWAVFAGWARLDEWLPGFIEHGLRLHVQIFVVLDVDETSNLFPGLQNSDPPLQGLPQIHQMVDLLHSAHFPPRVQNLVGLVDLDLGRLRQSQHALIVMRLKAILLLVHLLEFYLVFSGQFVALVDQKTGFAHSLKNHISYQKIFDMKLLLTVFFLLSSKILSMSTCSPMKPARLCWPKILCVCK